MQRILLSILLLLLSISCFAQTVQSSEEIKPIKLEGVKIFEKMVIESKTNQKFLDEVLPKYVQMHHLSRTQISYPVLKYNGGQWAPKYKFSNVSQLIQTVHNAFSLHAPIALSPEIIWYCIIHEVSICIKSHPKKYAHYFTDSPDKKKTIKVKDNSLVYGSPDNDWARTIGLFKKPLEDNVTPKAMKTFLPNFSSMTEEAKVAILVTFMDGISKYYKYEVWTECGIPEIKLVGTPDDWDLLVTAAKDLQVMFPTLQDYFKTLLPILELISEGAKGKVDKDFWCSIYKYRSGSGGVFVNGWITALNAYYPNKNGLSTLKKNFEWAEYDGDTRPQKFPSHVSKVDFKWIYHGKRIDMMFFAGIIGVDYVDGKYLKPSLGFGVIEIETKSDGVKAKSEADYWTQERMENAKPIPNEKEN